MPENQSPDLVVSSCSNLATSGSQDHAWGSLPSFWIRAHLNTPPRRAPPVPPRPVRPSGPRLASGRADPSVLHGATLGDVCRERFRIPAVAPFLFGRFDQLDGLRLFRRAREPRSRPRHWLALRRAPGPKLNIGARCGGPILPRGLSSRGQPPRRLILNGWPTRTQSWTWCWPIPTSCGPFLVAHHPDTLRQPPAGRIGTGSLRR